jgi:Domain of unknown function (DUF4291)
MPLKTTPYSQYETNLPQTGQHIVGQLREQNIIVYQAFNAQIAEYAVKNQSFGGTAYSFSRMSWIKPNFLWMMYRAGWAEKPNQERVLAVEIGLDKFEMILGQAVYAAFQSDIYGSHDNWENALKTSDVRLQWDPDHDPLGKKLQRRAIQIGMRGDILKKFAIDWVVSIEDVTDFVKMQGIFVKKADLNSLLVMQEQVISIENPALIRHLKLDKPQM